MSLPAEISWAQPESFAGRTVRQRFSGMLDLVAEGNPDLLPQVRRLRDLVAEMLAGGTLRAERFERPTPYWASWLAERDGTPYRDLSFFEIEFVFHHAINSFCGTYASGRDPFEFLKRRAADQALARVTESAAVIADAEETGDGLRVALLRSVYANIADASQLTDTTSSSVAHQPLVADESVRALGLLSENTAADTDTTFILADNSGLELGLDLLLIDRLLRIPNAARIELAVKPWPMFVSDAIVRDVEAQLALWSALPDEHLLRQVADRLDLARKNDQLAVRDDTDWGEPRHFPDLEPALAAALGNGRMTISKGDLNYRRHFGDRHWPYDTPIEIAAGSIGFGSILLRVLKSDILVGVDPDRAQAIERDDPHWLTDSRYAVVQCLEPRATGTRRYAATARARSVR
jgi:hypothetical protein